MFGDEVHEKPGEQCYNNEQFIDEKTGQELDYHKVKAARCEEMEFVKKIPLHDEVDEAECWEQTGKAPVSTKWVDIN